MPGENIDLTSDNSGDLNPSGSAGRRFVGVHFVCCDVYSRVYINREQSAYQGNCPRCARQIKIQIGPGGTSSRFFTAG